MVVKPKIYGGTMSKKLDSLAEYQRRVDLIMQEIADSEEKQLLARLRSLPAQDERHLCIEEWTPRVG
jgi:hypothetical protein